MKQDKKRPKVCCEVCGDTDTTCLDRHHIVPRTDPNCTNDDYNLAILCSSCHRKAHNGAIKIIGVFPSTNPNIGKILVYVKDGVCNVPGMEEAEPYYKPRKKKKNDKSCK